MFTRSGISLNLRCLNVKFLWVKITCVYETFKQSGAIKDTVTKWNKNILHPLTEGRLLLIPQPSPVIQDKCSEDKCFKGSSSASASIYKCINFIMNNSEPQLTSRCSFFLENSSFAPLDFKKWADVRVCAWCCKPLETESGFLSSAKLRAANPVSFLSFILLNTVLLQTSRLFGLCHSAMTANYSSIKIVISTQTDTDQTDATEIATCSKSKQLRWCRPAERCSLCKRQADSTEKNQTFILKLINALI